MYRSNRPQQYAATNRMFGPYLPPYPLQGVGLAGIPCTVAQGNVQISQSAYDAVVAACSTGSANDCINITSLKATLDAAQADLASCEKPAVVPSNLDITPIPWDKLPKVDPEPPKPQPQPPQPQPPLPKPPLPEPPKPEPAKAASTTNWPLIIGIAAAVGVVGIIALKKKK